MMQKGMQGILSSLKGAMEDGELMLMLDSLFESMTGSGFLSQAEKTLKKEK